MATRVTLDDTRPDLCFDSLSQIFVAHGETRDMLRQMDDMRRRMFQGSLLKDVSGSLRLAVLWYRLGKALLRAPATISRIEAPLFAANDIMAHTCWKTECLYVIANACLCVERYCATVYYPRRLGYRQLVMGAIVPTEENPIRWLRLAVALLYWARYNIAETCATLLPGSEAVARIMANTLIDRLRCDVYVISTISTTIPDSQTNICLFMRAIKPLGSINVRARLVFLCFEARYHRYRRDHCAEGDTLETILETLPLVTQEWRSCMAAIGASAGKEVDEWFNLEDAAVRNTRDVLRTAGDHGTRLVGTANIKVPDLGHYSGQDVLQWVGVDGANLAIPLSLDLEKICWPQMQLS
jgi:hypothetical protein